MDKNAFILKIKAFAPGAILKSATFGRNEKASPLLWVELSQLYEVCKFLKTGEPGLRFDWLENFAAMEIDGALVLSYFLKSREKSDQVIVLRGLLVLDGVKKKVSARSVSDIWPESSLWEREAAELFGIEFSGKDGLRYQENHLLPPGWQGFPLRKGYEFPTEYLGITHSRPIETSE